MMSLVDGERIKGQMAALSRRLDGGSVAGIYGRRRTSVSPGPG
jgi:hypothetical protein